MDDETKPEEPINTTPDIGRTDPTQKDKDQKHSEEGKNKTGQLGEKESNIILGLKKRFGWKYRKVKPDGTRKEHHLKSSTGLEFKMRRKDIRENCEWLIGEITKGLEHLRIIGAKKVDDKENGRLLKGSREVKEEHALHTKPKDGSEIGYSKGSESELNPDGTGTPVKAESDKAEKPVKPETEADNREKTGPGGPGSGEPNDD